MKEILYIDMDGVVADFDKGIKKYCPNLDTFCSTDQEDYERRAKKVDEICEANPHIFLELEEIEGAIESVNILFEYFDIYFLSTPMWNVPESYTDKRKWLELKFGVLSKKKLILSHNKGLCIGKYLIDDRIKNGVENFTGTHIHFGTEKFPNWEVIVKYLVKQHKNDKYYENKYNY